MRSFSILSAMVLCTWSTHAQEHTQHIQQLFNFSQIEKNRSEHTLSVQQTKKDFYDIRYLRCEWLMTPAVRQISGRVTMVFTMLSSSGMLLLDLADPLLVEKVFNHEAELTGRDELYQINTSRFAKGSYRVKFPVKITAW